MRGVLRRSPRIPTFDTGIRQCVPASRPSSLGCPPGAACPFPLDQGRPRAPRLVRGEQCERHAPKSSENGLPTCSLVPARLKASAGRTSRPSWLSSCVGYAGEVFQWRLQSQALESAITQMASPSEAVLLADPALSPDLALLVERVCQNRQPWVVVAAAALTAWQQRDPVGWEKVSEWLDANGIALVRI